MLPVAFWWRLRQWKWPFILSIVSRLCRSNILVHCTVWFDFSNVLLTDWWAPRLEALYQQHNNHVATHRTALQSTGIVKRNENLTNNETLNFFFPQQTLKPEKRQDTMPLTTLAQCEQWNMVRKSLFDSVETSFWICCCVGTTIRDHSWFASLKTSARQRFPQCSKLAWLIHQWNWITLFTTPRTDLSVCSRQRINLPRSPVKSEHGQICKMPCRLWKNGTCTCALLPATHTSQQFVLYLCANWQCFP